MRQYSEELKSSIIAKMLPPNSISVPDLARETGIPKDTLYSWRIKHQRTSGKALAKPALAGELGSEEKFSVVIETASLNEVELSTYCRRKGLYPEQISAWRHTCLQANALAPTKVDGERLRRQAKEIKQLESELRRKEKALAGYAGSACPELSCEVLFGEQEWKAVYIVYKRQKPPEQPPTLDAMIKWLPVLVVFLIARTMVFPGQKQCGLGCNVALILHSLSSHIT